MNKTNEQLFFESLNEKQKRQYAALRANELGYFGVGQVVPGNWGFIGIRFGSGKKS